MKTAKIKSEQIPFNSSEVARQSVLLAERAKAMGLLSERNSGDLILTDIKLPFPEGLSQLLKRIKEEGIAIVHIIPDDLSITDKDPAALLRSVNEALAESPSPHTEWPTLEKILGADLLSRIVGISLSSFHRYRSGERETPDKVVVRLHYLALIVGDLSGIYNEFGVRRWFDRKRTQLGNKSPSELLSGDWDPNDKGPHRVKELAHALVALPAT